MRMHIARVALLSVCLVTTANAWIFTSTDPDNPYQSGVISGQWNQYQTRGYIVVESGDDPDDLTVTCSDPWLRGKVGIPYPEGGEMRVKVADRAYGSGLGLTGTCDVTDTSVPEVIETMTIDVVAAE